MMKIFSVLFLCCALYAKMHQDISGVVRVHIYPVCSEGQTFSGDVAFLVDKNEGLFMTMHCKSMESLSALVPFVRVETMDGRILRCHLVQNMQNLAVLKVWEEDKPLLQGLHVFSLRKTAPPIKTDVRFVGSWVTKTWTAGKISSTWSYDNHLSTVYEMTVNEKMLECGSPAVQEDTGEVVGVVARRHLATILLFSGEYLAFQWDYFKKNGALFTPHLGALFKKDTVRALEGETGETFKPRGYDCSKLIEKRLVIVGALRREDGVVLSPSLQVLDVVLAVDGTPVYEETHLWEALRGAYHKGAYDVTVKLWRYGVVREERVALRFFANTLAERVLRYGPCFFVEGVVGCDAVKRYLQVSCHGTSPLTRCEALKVDGHDVKTIADVKAALAHKDKDGVWLHAKTLKYTKKDEVASMPKKEFMYYLWAGKDAHTSDVYVNNGGWRKQC